MFRLMFKFFYYIFLFGVLIVVAYYATMVLPLILLGFLIFSIVKYLNQKKMSPTLSCPHCGNTELDVSTIHTKTSYSSKTSGRSFRNYGLFSSNGTWDTKTNSLRNYAYTHEARCRKCGHLFNYLTIEEVENIKKKSLITMIVFSILFAISIPVAITSISAERSNIKERNSEAYKYLWQIEPTPLKDFEYKINKNDNTMIIREYKKDTSSSVKKIYVASSYEVEGQLYDVVQLEDVRLGYSERKSIILGDGIKYVNEDIFRNGDDIKALYLPSSLEGVGKLFFSYCNKNLDDIYFGGSEEEFERIFGADAINEYLSTTLIHYDSSIEQILADAPKE